MIRAENTGTRWKVCNNFSERSSLVICIFVLHFCTHGHKDDKIGLPTHMTQTISVIQYLSCRVDHKDEDMRPEVHRRAQVYKLGTQVVTGFKPWTSCVGSDQSGNSGTSCCLNFMSWMSFKSRPIYLGRQIRKPFLYLSCRMDHKDKSLCTFYTRKPRYM